MASIPDRKPPHLDGLLRSRAFDVQASPITPPFTPRRSIWIAVTMRTAQAERLRSLRTLAALTGPGPELCRGGRL